MAASVVLSVVESGTTACLAFVCMYARLATQGNDFEVDGNALQ